MQPPKELDGTLVRGSMHRCMGSSVNPVFRLDALAKALSVIATATWLAGWLGVRHTPILYQNG